MSTPIDRLRKLLEPEPLDRDLFLANPGRGEGRLFGGLVAAQAVMAGGATLSEGQGDVHSLHGYFLRPGRHDRPIRIVVDRIRDGRSFTTRRVVAHQAGEAIFNMAVSFVRPEAGIEHQGEMPEAPGPEGLPDWEKVRSERLGQPRRRSGGPLEIRVCDPDDFLPDRAATSARMMWLRPRGEVPPGSLLNAALLVYASDRTLLGTAGRPHGLTYGNMQAASLDHAVWLHHPPRFDDWILYVMQSPVAHSARALIHGAMYRPDGVRIASVTQEGLIRQP